MKKEIKIIIFMIIIILALGSATVFYLLGQKVQMNSADTIGNTSANLFNDGLFCEDEGKVYFVNSDDNNCIYSMNADESDVKQLTEMNSRNILAAGKFIYYYMDSSESSSSLSGLGGVTNQYGIYRSCKDGSDQVCLLRELVNKLSLSGSNIYYQLKKSNGTDFYKIRIDKANDAEISDIEIDPSCSYNGCIYYSSQSDNFYLHKIDTQNGNKDSAILSESIYSPVISNGYLYYMDIENTYRLCRRSMQGDSFGDEEVLTNDRIDFFNLNDNFIFYAFSDPDEPALKYMNLDGSNPQVILNGIYNSLCLTSTHLYFKQYGTDTITFHMPLDFSEMPSEFHPGE